MPFIPPFPSMQPKLIILFIIQGLQSIMIKWRDFQLMVKFFLYCKISVIQMQYLSILPLICFNKRIKVKFYKKLLFLPPTINQIGTLYIIHSFGKCVFMIYDCIKKIILLSFSCLLFFSVVRIYVKKEEK